MHWFSSNIKNIDMISTQTTYVYIMNFSWFELKFILHIFGWKKCLQVLYYEPVNMIKCIYNCSIYNYLVFYDWKNSGFIFYRGPRDFYLASWEDWIDDKPKILAGQLLLKTMIE